jgi:hypothetical protein
MNYRSILAQGLHSLLLTPLPTIKPTRDTGLGGLTGRVFVNAINLSDFDDTYEGCFWPTLGEPHGQDYLGTSRPWWNIQFSSGDGESLSRWVCEQVIGKVRANDQ